jgi:hypothetical protein
MEIIYYKIGIDVNSDIDYIKSKICVDTGIEMIDLGIDHQNNPDVHIICIFVDRKEKMLNTYIKDTLLYCNFAKFTGKIIRQSEYNEIKKLLR